MEINQLLKEEEAQIENNKKNFKKAIAPILLEGNKDKVTPELKKILSPMIKKGLTLGMKWLKS